MKRREKAFSISGILVILVTILLFFITTQERTTITWLGFCFLIIAEIVFFGGMIFIEKSAKELSQIIVRSGLGSTITIYAIASIIVSLVYMNFFRDSIISFCVIQILLLAISMILGIVFYTSGKSTRSNDAMINDASAMINKMLSKMKLLMSNKEYKNDLEKLYDSLRFSDTSTLVKADYELDDKIQDLESVFSNDDENKNEKIDTLLNNISELINRRKSEVMESKRGSI